MKDNAIKSAKAWASDSYIEISDREYLNGLLADPEKNEQEIVESFYQDLEFGTGGLRSILGIGSNRMNKYNVRKAAQAMVNTLRETKTSGGVAAVSFDCRNFSKEFSREVASVFAANGMTVYIYENLAPTPMLSYAVRFYEADLGVMITASHNPKQYNGFKAYWSDGSQVTPPEDEMIIQAYNRLNDWNQIKFGDFLSFQKQGLINWVSGACIDAFYQTIHQQILDPVMCKEHGDQAHIIYTPLHGTGYHPCQKISQEMGFSRFEVVQSQAEYDGNFSTLVTTPNPEDPKALELAVALMLEENADVTYGTDPDGDRLGVVVNNKGIAHYLNGNQIAILMMHYILTKKQQTNSLPANPLIIKSLVTSPLQVTIAKKFNTTVKDTLTGFKWMAKLWRELEDTTDYEFVFASEESFGYMPHDKVRDKDAVASIALMNEIVLFYKLQSKNLIQALDDIYQEYGFAEESLIALTFEGITGKQKIERIMNFFRDHNQNKIGENEVHIFSDYLEQKEIHFESNQTTDIEMTKSNVLGFTFQNGNKLFLRPSGTEPKIKFYTMVQVAEGSLEDKKATAKKQIAQIESYIHQKVAEL